MRVYAFGIATLCASACTLSGPDPQIPANPVAPVKNRARATQLTEQFGPSGAAQPAARPPRENLREGFLFFDRTGEFGRTPGDVSELRGRDHHQYGYTGLGVKRNIYMEDVMLYSPMGIDWKESIKETPSRRSFCCAEPFAAKAMIGAPRDHSAFGVNA